MPNTQNNITQLERLSAQKGGIPEMLKRLSTVALDTLLESMKVHKDSSRFEALSKEVFAQDLANIFADRMAMDTAEATMNSAIEVAFIKEYFDKSFDWKRYESDVMEAIKHVARGEGARDAGAGALG